MDSKKKSRAINLVLIGIIVIAGGFGIYAAVRAISIKAAYNQRDSKYETLANTYTKISDDYTEEMWAENPEGESVTTFPVTVNFDDLNAECRFGSVAGWLYSPGTVINYPVVQCDDNYYYLYHLMDGTENSGGTLYSDFRCLNNFAGETTIVYGHHMSDGSMFASLKNYYTDPSYYSEHPCMYLSTPTGNYRLDVFSAYSTVTEDDKTFATSFSAEFPFREYINHLKNLNSISTVPQVQVDVTDRIVLLVTCAYETNNSRTVVACKMVPYTD